MNVMSMNECSLLLQAPSYTDVFRFNWKPPTGETYECPAGMSYTENIWKLTI